LCKRFHHFYELYKRRETTTKTEPTKSSNINNNTKCKKKRIEYPLFAMLSDFKEL